MKLQRNKGTSKANRLVQSKIRVYLCTLVILPTCIFFASQGFAKAAIKFPFVGEIIADSVNVRAGQSSNFEKLIQLKESDEVVVVQAQYSWYKVQLPKEARIFVSKKYVQELSDNKAIIIADKVNVRAGADVKNSIIGQLTKGDLVEISERLDEWYRILPWDNSYGWVSQEFIRFKSQDVASVRKFVAETPVVTESAPVVQLKSEILSVETVMRIKGKVVKSSLQENSSADMMYQLNTSSGQYFLSAPVNILGKFLNKEVKVEGKISSQPSPQNIPVLRVSKIEIIL